MKRAILTFDGVVFILSFTALVVLSVLEARNIQLIFG